MAKQITREQAEKITRNQERVAKKWQAAGHSLEIISEGLWNKMAARTQVRNGKLEIWAQYPGETKSEVKAIIG